MQGCRKRSTPAKAIETPELLILEGATTKHRKKRGLGQ